MLGPDGPDTRLAAESADFDLAIAENLLWQARNDLLVARHVKDWGEPVRIAEERLADARARVRAIRRDIIEREGRQALERARRPA